MREDPLGQIKHEARVGAEARREHGDGEEAEGPARVRDSSRNGAGVDPHRALPQGNRIWKDLREFAGLAGLAGLRSDRFYLWRRESSLWRRYWNSLWHAGRNWMIREPGTRLFTISTNS